MKVLFITNIPVPYRIDFFNELGKYVELTVAFERRVAQNRNKEWLSSSIYNFKAIFMKGINIGEESAFCPEICKLIKNGKFDCVILGVYHTTTAMLAIQYMKIINQNYYLSSDGGFIKNDSYLKEKVKKHFLSGAVEYFSPGENTTKYLINYGANKEKINLYTFSSMKKEDIIQQRCSKSKKEIIKKELGINEKKIILSVGQFIYRKGYDLLIEATNDLSNEVGVYVVGGKITEEYKELIKKYNNKNIHFIDFMNKELLKKYYLASDLFVLPTREDIWGLVINEALSYGLPVVTTNMCNAGLELINNGKNGIIIPADNSIALKNAINNLINDEKKLEEMSKESLNIAKKYTIEEMVNSHINKIVK